MRGRVARRLLAALALALAAVASAAPLAAQADDREGDLERIRGEISRLQSRLLRLRDRATGLEGELARTELELELQQKRVEETRAERTLAESSLERLTLRVARLEELLETTRRELAARLVELYRLGRHGALRLLLSIRSEEQLLPGIRLMRYLARREAKTLEVFLDRRVRLAFERDELAAQRLEIERLLGVEDARLAALERTRREQARLLAAVERERQSLAAERERLADKEQKLANLLDFLYGRNPEPLAGTPLERFRGALDWPVAGTVVAGFGPRLDPRYGTRVPHNGLSIATRPGASVRAIFPGRVLFAAPFSGYGPTAVVTHPGRALTLYAGLRRLGVGEGDVVSLGTVVGEAGDRLYFEIRVQNRPVDPVRWLR